MKILTKWLREYLPALDVSDRQLAEDLTLRGIAVEGVHVVGNGGHLFEMDITTNRVDAMNHYGVAREAAAIYGVPLLGLEDARVLAAEAVVARSEEKQIPSLRYGMTSGEAVAAGEKQIPSLRYGMTSDGEGSASVDVAALLPEQEFPVRIEAPEMCGRFTAQVIQGVTVGPSVGVVAERFALLGQKPISNAVDVTNYTWLAMGHPTHAFDLDTLEGGIVVRRARAGERLRLLDGSEKVLFDDDLVIADEVKALGLAGVMGGWDSRVTEATRNILVEAAWFDPAAIRRSSRRHGLHTDASHRFERGADLGTAALANRLVTRGIVAACGGEAVGPLVDVTVAEAEARTTKRPRVRMSVDTVQRLLGTTVDGGAVPADAVEQYLEALGCALRPTPDGGAYEVGLPSWRLDLQREIDLIEEVARVYGYNRFADTLPSFAGDVIALPDAAREAKTREVLLQLGWTEAISSTFCSEAEAAMFSGESAVAMGNPLNAEAGVLRPSLLPGMMEMLALNATRDVAEVRLFEFGTVFTGSTAVVTERASLALGMYGGAAASRIVGASDALFFEMKGAVEELLSRFVSGPVEFREDALPAWMEAGRGARAVIDGEVVAWFGELRSGERERRKLKEVVVIGEVSVPALFAHELRQPLVREPSRFQAVERDLSFLFTDAVRWEDVSGAVRGLGIREMILLEPVEIFRDAKGKAVPRGEYSLLFRMIYQSNERTLREDELAGWQEAVIGALVALGGKHRAPEAVSG